MYKRQAYDFLLVKPLLSLGLQSLLPAQEDESHDAPEVIEPVGVKEVHTPSLARWREAAKEQHARSIGQERFQRMLFDSHLSVQSYKEFAVRTSVILRLNPFSAFLGAFHIRLVKDGMVCLVAVSYFLPVLRMFHEFPFLLRYKIIHVQSPLLG